MKYILLLSLIALTSFSSGKSLPTKPEDETASTGYNFFLRSASPIFSDVKEQKKFVNDNLPSVPKEYNLKKVIIVDIGIANEPTMICLVTVYENAITQRIEGKLTCPPDRNVGNN